MIAAAVAGRSAFARSPAARRAAFALVAPSTSLSGAIASATFGTAAFDTTALATTTLGWSPLVMIPLSFAMAMALGLVVFVLGKPMLDGHGEPPDPAALARPRVGPLSAEGLIYAAGTIAGGKSRYDPMNGAVIGSETLIDYIRQARRDSTLKAIVVRIDSPGGSATASDAVWHELMRAREEKPERPIVASMSDLAASGGYYIAMAAPTIVAEPSTLRFVNTASAL